MLNFVLREHFISDKTYCRRGRITVQEREKEADDTEEALEKRRQQEEERRKQSHDLVAESIKRELAESMFQLFKSY